MKPFAWSYSRIKGFEACPRKHHEVDLLKNPLFKEKESPELAWGNKVHQTFASVLQGKMVLPGDMIMYQKWIDKVNQLPGKLYVEQQYALDKDFQPTDWFGPRAWFRGIADAAKIAGYVGAALDWKTGKTKKDPVQLMLLAQCLFSNFPDLQRVHVAFVWLQEDTTSPAIYERADMAALWNGVFPRVKAYEQAYNANIWPPKPSGLCMRHCPVTTCQYNGKGSF